MEIDDTLAEARTTLAFDSIFRWEWAAAESGFKRAIELNPSYATARHWYGLYLSWTGRHEEAIAEMKRAREVDPLSLIIGNALGAVFYHARQYDQAIEHHQEILKVDENFHPAHIGLALAYLQKGMFEAAIAEFQWVVDRGGAPYTLASLGHAYAVAGDTAEAEKIVTQLDDASLVITAPFDVARIYVALGQEEKALQWLEKAYEEDPNVVTLKVDPSFDPLRSDPRFQDLLRRMNFPE